MNEKKICASCIQDDYLGYHIKENGNKDVCGFCGKKRIVMYIDDMVRLIQDGIEFIYDDPTNGLGWMDGEWVGMVKDTYDILVEETDIGTSPAFNSILDSLPTNQWCKKEFYGPDDSEEMYFTWEFFIRQVKYKTRFFFIQDKTKIGEYSRFKKPYEILKELIRVFENLNLFTDLDKRTTIYRVRKEKKSGDYYTPEQLGSPSPENCIYSNRMSPAGISMFYGSEDKETCFLEIGAKKGIFAVGEWLLNDKVKILDLTKDFNWNNGYYYYPDFPSIFDESRRYLYHDYAFILKFANDLSKKVTKNQMENIDYVPTQIITEYLRVIAQNMNIKGICFYSSLNGHKNYCLFFDDKDCKNSAGIELKSVNEEDIK